jgi:MerR family mercuric resistance operon transcriptional regulator
VAPKVRRITFIKRAKELGFTLSEVGELLSLRVDPRTTCSQLRDRAHAKIADIDQRLRALERMRNALLELSQACTGSGSTSECPILDALDGSDGG